ncbi:tripartite ATP-independent periplasmic transporter solute receptor, DctP family [Gottschalkia purinilytica]|uniref:Tripartite ATP-independent periplasmic transporter solute receptor, DctP family n=1 Tax=Gottschalkia purinilytica TaxID=1503 RepID=A0A0L0WDY8_GOTPU|nr:TRAP transporter substrate-binding protein [Gottschalkia purinilytica]KNF09693.1 tripartite ATP-independent periplasmic transporter solute receptor, DctP family [Gottschalkia purinilytica]
MVKKLKSIFLLISLFAFTFIIQGCSLSNQKANSNDVIQINYGHGFMPETPHHKSSLKFKEEVEKKTNGKVKVNVFPSSQLGSAREMFEGLQLGTQEIALVPTARISGFAPELQLFDLPFLFPSRDTAYKLMDGKVGNDLLKTLEKQYVKGVVFYEDGFKHFTSNNKITEAKDFKGQKFRTMESPIVMKQFKSLGANPVPIDFAELYNSLQLGVIDGQENPLVTIENMKFYEVQDYLLLSEHAYLGHALLFNDNWFKKLPKDIQKILYDTGRELAKWQRKEVQKEEEKYLKTIEKSGTKIIKLNEKQKKELKKITNPVHKEYVKMFGDKILNDAYREIERLEGNEVTN